MTNELLQFVRTENFISIGINILIRTHVYSTVDGPQMSIAHKNELNPVFHTVFHHDH